MVLRMSRPWKHPDTGIYWYRKRVPDALRTIVGKREHKETLRTRDPQLAKIEHARVAAEVEARWRQLASGTQTLTQKQAQAIAGEIYRDMVTEHEENPGRLPGRMLGLLLDRAALRAGSVRALPLGDSGKAGVLMEKVKEGRVRENARRVDEWLRDKGLILSEESRVEVGAAVDRAILQAREQLHRMSGGDYRADPDSDRFPALDLSATAKLNGSVRSKAPSETSPVAVFEAYAKERALEPRSLKRWRPIIEGVQREVPDLRDLTREWVVAWKDRMVAGGELDARTIREANLASLRAVCQWAVDNGKIAINPVAGVKVRSPKKPKTRPKGYTDIEAHMILATTQITPPPRVSAAYCVARRWVPWLCAFTGARVGEIAQLRREDVREREGVWCLWITPEAGATKDGNSRWVAVHPCLIEQGFIDFVRKSRSGPLFYDPRKKRGGENPQFLNVGEHIARWVREEVGIIDKEIQPNHAWRHRFTTISRKHDMDPGARDYMQGHAPATVGEDYGDWEPEALLREISKLPAIHILPSRRALARHRAEQLRAKRRRGSSKAA
jgi:integrase